MPHYPHPRQVRHPAALVLQSYQRGAAARKEYARRRAELLEKLIPRATQLQVISPISPMYLPYISPVSRAPRSCRRAG